MYSSKRAMDAGNAVLGRPSSGYPFTVGVTFEFEQLKKLDFLRGNIPRNPFIRTIVESFIDENGATAPVTELLTLRKENKALKNRVVTLGSDVSRLTRKLELREGEVTSLKWALDALKKQVDYDPKEVSRQQRILKKKPVEKLIEEMFGGGVAGV